MKVSKLHVLFSLVLLSYSFILSAKLPIEHWQTDKGMQVYFLSTSALPIVDIAIAFDAGSARDGEQKGVASLTNKMLREGTEQLDANTVVEEFENRGTIFSEGVSRDTASLQMRSLVDNKILEPSLALFSQVISQPSFPEANLERLRQEALMTLDYQQQLPGALVANEFNSLLYKSHPYASQTLGEVETLETLTTDDLREFYQRYYVASNAVLAIVGDIERAQAQSIAEQIEADLQQGERVVSLPDVEPVVKEEKKDLHFPSQQTHILIGQVGINRSHEDYFPLQIANHALGNPLTSRLFMEVREKRGLSYSASSSLSPMKQAGLFILSLQTDNQQVEEALAVTLAELNKWVDAGITEAEFELAKDNLSGRYLFSMISNAAITGQLLNIGINQLPLDYLDTYVDNIKAVTLEQVQASIRRHIHPDKLIVVTVGGNE